MECRIIKNVPASVMEAEMGGQFINFQTGEYLQIIIPEMIHTVIHTGVNRQPSYVCIN